MHLRIISTALLDLVKQTSRRAVKVAFEGICSLPSLCGTTSCFIRAMSGTPSPSSMPRYNMTFILFQILLDIILLYMPGKWYSEILIGASVRQAGPELYIDILEVHSNRLHSNGCQLTF